MQKYLIIWSYIKVSWVWRCSHNGTTTTGNLKILFRKNDDEVTVKSANTESVLKIKQNGTTNTYLSQS